MKSVRFVVIMLLVAGMFWGFNAMRKKSAATPAKQEQPVSAPQPQSPPTTPPDTLHQTK